MGDQQQGRQQDRAERVDVLERIEAHPALAPGGVVSEQMRDEAMRRLVKGESAKPVQVALVTAVDHAPTQAQR